MDKILDKFREFSVSIYGNLETFNEVASKARARVFYKYGNRNGSYITDEFAEKLISSLPYTPIKGIYDEDDYTDHGYSRSLGRIYGIVPENPNVTWEKFVDEDGIEREYACTDVILFTALYAEANEIIGKSLSMEIYEKSIKGDWQYINGRKQYVFSDGCFLGLQILGDEVEPCFEGAAFFNLTNQSLTDIIDKINKFNLSFQNKWQGGNIMPGINFKLSDSDKHDMIFNLLNPNYNENSNWDLDYVIVDIYDVYAVVFSCKNRKYERAYYTKDNDTDSVSIDKMEDCFIIDVNEKEKNALATIQALNGGTYECINDNFTINSEVEQKTSEFEQKIEELTTANATLTTEKETVVSQYAEAQTLLEQAKTSLTDAQTSLSTLQAENQELSAYKKNVEDTNKKAIIENYTELLSEEVINKFTASLDSYSIEDLDKELTYEVKKANPSVFSKNNDHFGYVPKDQPKTGLDAILSKYAK